MTAEQLRGPFEKFVDSPFSKETVTAPPQSSGRDEDHATTTVPPPLQLGITVTASLCVTAAHCRQSTNFANGLVFYDTVSTAEVMYLQMRYSTW
jgi:hypothetical protein